MQSLGDEDHSYLEEMATSGVSLGVDETMPRTPEVFEEKTKVGSRVHRRGLGGQDGRQLSFSGGELGRHQEDK